MAIDFGRAARGIATGYLAAKVADTAEQDKMNRDFILQARDQYFNVDKPQFVAEEKERQANIKYIQANLPNGVAISNYADVNDFTLDKRMTVKFVDDVKNLTDDERFNLESTIIQRKKDRTQTFDDKHSHIVNNEQFKSGGSGSMNMMKVFFPKEGEDIGEVGIGQAKVPMTENITPLSEITGTSGNMYDISNPKHLQLERIASTAFDKQFFDRTQNRYIFSIPADKNKDGSFVDSRYPTLQFIKEGYDDAVNNGYNLGFANYARDKFVQGVLDRRGIEGFTGTLPQETPAAEAGTTEAAATTTETKAEAGDGKKFDAPDTSQIGVKEDAKINLQSKRKVEGGGFGSAATVINDLRDIIARISDSPSLSDDDKSSRIDTARARAKERLEAMGLDSDNFNL